MALYSNQPYQPIHNSGTSVWEGAGWGALKGAAGGGIVSAWNQFAMTRTSDQIKNMPDPLIGMAIEGHQSGYRDGKAFGAKSPIVNWATEVGLGAGKKTNTRRMIGSTILGAALGGLHAASDGILG